MSIIIIQVSRSRVHRRFTPPRFIPATIHRHTRHPPLTFR